MVGRILCEGILSVLVAPHLLQQQNATQVRFLPLPVCRSLRLLAFAQTVRSVHWLTAHLSLSRTYVLPQKELVRVLKEQQDLLAQQLDRLSSLQGAGTAAHCPESEVETGGGLPSSSSSSSGARFAPMGVVGSSSGSGLNAVGRRSGMLGADEEEDISMA